MGRCHMKGFTIIEVLIVVAIVFILAAILIPAYQRNDPPGPRKLDLSQIYVDPETGCQYWRLDPTGGALAARRDRDGKQICGGQ